MATILQIADAVTTLLNAHVFTPPFTATREYLPRFDLQDLESEKVTVVPSAVEQVNLDRHRVQEDHEIFVGFQQRTNLSAADLDAKVAQVEAVADYLRTTPLAGDLARWVGQKIDPVYSPDHLDEKRVFTSLLRVTYRLAR